MTTGFRHLSVDGLRLHVKMQRKTCVFLDVSAAAVEAALGDLLDLADRG